MGTRAQAWSEMATATQDGHPGKDFGAVTQRGLKAQTLGRAHPAALAARLPAGMLDGLAADLQKLGVNVAGEMVARSSVETAMKSRNESLAQEGRAGLWRAIGNMRANYFQETWNRGAAYRRESWNRDART